MFDQILDLVKQQLNKNPEVAAAIPDTEKDAVHEEVATQVTQGLAGQAVAQGGIGGLLSQLQNGLGSGNTITNAIEGGLVGTLGSKFNLPPAVTGAIAAALPGILQKLAHKANDPNDNSITPGGLSDVFSKFGSGGLGSLGNMFGFGK